MLDVAMTPLLIRLLHSALPMLASLVILSLLVEEDSVSNMDESSAIESVIQQESKGRHIHIRAADEHQVSPDAGTLHKGVASVGRSSSVMLRGRT